MGQGCPWGRFVYRMACRAERRAWHSSNVPEQARLLTKAQNN